MMPLVTLQNLDCCLKKLRGEVQPAIDDVFGNAVMTNGSATVNDTAVTASSIVILSRMTISGTPGNLYYTITPGAAVTIASSSNADTSTVSYHIRH